ncbi:MAG: hypothetical protein U9N76_04580, partial [Candidatus Marinimicrobia bacterium]|nr:hypothetical protein [Candidatus Neomarinimicrobiota bacterium]
MINSNTINTIIKEITPHYNNYVGNKSTISANQSLKIMWDIGDILKSQIEKLNVPPHNLYRQIYGKSESNKNILQKSYITREFQGRCFRIRNIFLSKKDIDLQLPNLKSFTCFREAMPFFDNDKYKFSGAQKELLLNLLNSNQKASSIINEIKQLQKKYIGIKNTRTQRLKELNVEKEKFIFIYNEIYRILTNLEYDKFKKNLDISNDLIINFSQLTSALVSEEIVTPNLIKSNDLPEPFESLNVILNKLFSKEKMTERSRFRRLIPPERISKLSDMIFALTERKLFE